MPSKKKLHLSEIFPSLWLKIVGGLILVTVLFLAWAVWWMGDGDVRLYNQVFMDAKTAKVLQALPPVEEWQVYESEQFHISLKVPPGWSVINHHFSSGPELELKNMTYWPIQFRIKKFNLEDLNYEESWAEIVNQKALAKQPVLPGTTLIKLRNTLNPDYLPAVNEPPFMIMIANYYDFKPPGFPQTKKESDLLIQKILETVKVF